MEYLSNIFLYLLVFFLSSGLIFRGLKHRQTKTKFGLPLIILGILIPSVMAGIRYGVGADFSAYLQMFNNATDGRQLYYRAIEPASAALITVSAFFRSSILMFFSFNLITNFCFFRAFQRIFKNNAKQTTLAYLFYLCILYSTTLNAMRSGVAMALIALAFSYLIQKWSKKSILKSLLAIALATLFHKSALLALCFFPIFWLAKKYSSRNILGKKVVRFIYLLLAFLAPAIYTMTSSFLPIGDYARYLTGFGSEFSIPLANIMMSVPILYSAIYFFGTKNSQDKRFKEILYCASFYIPLAVFVGWLTYADGLSRASFLLEPLVICLMVLLITSVKKSARLWRVIVVISMLAVAGTMLVRNLNWSLALPYKTVFQEGASHAPEN